MNSAKNILLKALEAIDYSDNREAFADEFLRNIRLQALVNLMQSLPAERQAVFKQQLSEIQDNPEKLASLLKEQSSQQEIHQALEAVANRQLSENQDAPEKIASLLKKYFSQQEINEALKNATKYLVTQYIQTITPTLSPDQKEKLIHVMEEAGQVQAA